MKKFFLIGICSGLILGLLLGFLVLSSQNFNNFNQQGSSRINEDPSNLVQDPKPETVTLVEGGVNSFWFFGELVDIDLKKNKITVLVDLSLTFKDYPEKHKEITFQMTDDALRAFPGWEDVFLGWEAEDLVLEQLESGDKLMIYPNESIFMIYEKDIIEAWTLAVVPKDIYEENYSD